jgi:integrase
MAIRVEVKRQFKTDLDGIIRLAISENGTRKYKSLGISIPLCKFSKSKQRVLSSYIGSNDINKQIENKIREYSITPLNTFKNGSDELIYVLNSLNNYKASTSVNVVHAINYIEKYLKSKKQTIKVSDLNVNIVLGFRDYMFQNALGQNSVKMYIAIFKMLINKAIEHNLVDYNRHPFVGIKVKGLKTEKVYLSIQEIDKLRFYSGKNDLVRDIFLFQFFGYGMRISEMLLMKWSNFQLKDNRLFLRYYQVKAKPLMQVEVNVQMLNILDKYLPIKNDNNISNLNKEIDVVNKEIDSVKLRQRLNVNRELMPPKYTTQPILAIHNITPQQLKTLDYSNGNLDIQLDNLTNKLTQIQSKLAFYKISKMPSKHPIFRFSGVLDSYKTGSDLTLSQYKEKQRITNMLNKRLKQVCKAIQITLITTHSARHSFSRLMQQKGMSVDNIGNILGHTSSKNTFIYLSELINGEANKEAAGHFNIFK